MKNAHRLTFLILILIVGTSQAYYFDIVNSMVNKAVQFVKRTLRKVSSTVYEKTEIYAMTINKLKEFSEIMKEIYEAQAQVNSKYNEEQDKLTDKLLETLKDFIVKSFYQKYNDPEFEILDTFLNEDEFKESYRQFQNAFESVDIIKVEDFVKGVFEGLSRSPFDENRCYKKDFKKYYPGLVGKVFEVVTAFKDKKNVGGSLISLYSYLEGIKGLKDNCNLEELVYKIYITSFPLGQARFIYKLLYHRTELWEHYHKFHTSAKNDDFNSAGVAFGRMIGLFYSFSTK